MDEWIHKWTYIWMNGYTNGQTERQRSDGLINRQMNK